MQNLKKILPVLVVFDATSREVHHSSHMEKPVTMSVQCTEPQTEGSP